MMGLVTSDRYEGNVRTIPEEEFGIIRKWPNLFNELFEGKTGPKPHGILASNSVTELFVYPTYPLVKFVRMSRALQLTLRKIRHHDLFP